MHLSENTNQFDNCDETKKVYAWLIPHCKPELKEITMWKLYVEAVIESEARPAVVQLKTEV